MGFPPASRGHIGDTSSILGLGRSPGGGHGNPLQYVCLENSHGPKSLEGYSPWGCKESDTTEWLSTAQHIHMVKYKIRLSKVLFLKMNVGRNQNMVYIAVFYSNKENNFCYFKKSALLVSFKCLSTRIWYSYGLILFQLDVQYSKRYPYEHKTKTNSFL